MSLLRGILNELMPSPRVKAATYHFLFHKKRCRDRLPSNSVVLPGCRPHRLLLAVSSYDECLHHSPAAAYDQQPRFSPPAAAAAAAAPHRASSHRQRNTRLRLPAARGVSCGCSVDSFCRVFTAAPTSHAKYRESGFFSWRRYAFSISAQRCCPCCATNTAAAAAVPCLLYSAAAKRW